MKCLYYLTSNLENARKITDDLHEAGIGDWYIHVLSKDEAGLKKEKIHSSNYLEQLDILRYGIIGGIAGLVVGLIAAGLMNWAKLFGPELPPIVNYAVIGFFILLGSWEGGLTGIATENKKIALFHAELEAGSYLILIYAKDAFEERVKQVMAVKYPEAKLVAADVNFYNPFAGLKRM